MTGNTVYCHIYGWRQPSCQCVTGLPLVIKITDQTQMNKLLKKTTGNDLLPKETAKSGIKKTDKACMRLREMGGVLFSNSISIVTVKTKARTKENYLLNYWGSWHTCCLCSVLEWKICLRIIYSSAPFFSFPQQYTEAFGGRIPNDKYCAFIKSWGKIFTTQKKCIRPYALFTFSWDSGIQGYVM